MDVTFKDGKLIFLPKNEIEHYALVRCRKAEDSEYEIKEPEPEEKEIVEAIINNYCVCAECKNFSFGYPHVQRCFKYDYDITEPGYQGCIHWEGK